MSCFTFKYDAANPYKMHNSLVAPALLAESLRLTTKSESLAECRYDIESAYIALDAIHSLTVDLFPHLSVEFGGSRKEVALAITANLRDAMSASRVTRCTMSPANIKRMVLESFKQPGADEFAVRYRTMRRTRYGAKASLLKDYARQVEIAARRLQDIAVSLVSQPSQKRTWLDDAVAVRFSQLADALLMDAENAIEAVNKSR